MGAKLGAILCELPRTAVDVTGLERRSFQVVWTPMDACGHGLEIYGSGGCVFESRRARQVESLLRWGFRRVGSVRRW